MELRKKLSLIGLAASLTACGKHLPVSPKPACPGGGQIETSYTGPFIAGDRTFRTTGRRGELVMDYGGKRTHLDDGDGVRYTVNYTIGLSPAEMIDFRVRNKATDFGTITSVIASCTKANR